MPKARLNTPNLMLSRHPGESIMVGDETEITVVEVRGDKVKIGVQAPRELAVHRKEVWLRIQQEKRAAEQAGSLLPPPAEALDNLAAFDSVEGA